MIGSQLALAPAVAVALAPAMVLAVKRRSHRFRVPGVAL